MLNTWMTFCCTLTEGLAMQIRLLEMEETDRQETRQLCHDLNNHLQVIKELCAKREEAVRKGIRFSCEGDFSALHKMAPIDVCTILSNVLDNALEAASQVQNGEIAVRGILHKNFYTLMGTNSVKKNISIRHNRYRPPSMISTAMGSVLQVWRVW